MCDPDLPKNEGERDGYEFAAEVVDELLGEIDRVRHVLRLDRYTAVRVVAILFDLREDKLLWLTGERPT